MLGFASPRPSHRALAAVARAALAALAGLTPSSASAAWGPVLQPAASGGAGQVALAVAPTGDVAAAWVRDERGSVTVRAAVARGVAPMTGHRLLAARNRGVQGLAVVLDARGELTVAWVEQASAHGRRHGHITLRAAYRTPTGRWSAVQAVSRTSAFFYAQPRLAAARDGTVALTFNAAVRAAPGVGVAWRSPGHRFGQVQSVPTGRRGYLQEPALAFDSGGRAYLTGIARCDDEQHSAGVLLTTTSRSRRFGAPRTITPQPATHLRFVVTGRGRATATWLRAGCSTSEDLAGAVQGRIVAGTRLGAPVTVDPLSSTAPSLARATGADVDAAWTEYGPLAPGGRVVTSRIGSSGSASPPSAPGDGWVPIVADGRGDQLVERLAPANTGAPGAAGARSGGAPVEPSPLDGSAWFTGAAAPFGQALAAARPGTAALKVSVWRPAP
jgi:hypothetical protein